MAPDDDRPDDWPIDAEWPPEVGWLVGDDPPPIVGLGPIPPPGVPTLTWCATLVGPFLLWALGFWLFGFGQPDVREPECSGFCFTPRQEVWFVGLVYGAIAVPMATLVGAVIVALAAPANRLVAALVVLGVDAGALGALAGWAVET